MDNFKGQTWSWFETSKGFFASCRFCSAEGVGSALELNHRMSVKEKAGGPWREMKEPVAEHEKRKRE